MLVILLAWFILTCWPSWPGSRLKSGANIKASGASGIQTSQNAGESTADRATIVGWNRGWD